MKPFYDDGQITLYCGDMREVVPALGLSADAIVTDPPYGETSLEWDRWPEGWPKVAAAVAPQMWCFGSLRMFWDKGYDLAAGKWGLAQDVVWQKHNGTNPNNDRFRRVHELAVHFYREGTPWADLYKCPVYVPGASAKTVRRKKRPTHWGDIGGALYRSEDGGPKLEESVIYARSCHGYAVHPTQKPEAIIRPLLQYSVPPGGVVVDFFAGSGTTLAVAREMGLRAVGIEGKEVYCHKIVERLSQGCLALAGSGF